MLPCTQSLTLEKSLCRGFVCFKEAKPTNTLSPGGGLPGVNEDYRTVRRPVDTPRCVFGGTVQLSLCRPLSFSKILNYNNSCIKKDEKTYSLGYKSKTWPGRLIQRHRLKCGTVSDNGDRSRDEKERERKRSRPVRINKKSRTSSAVKDTLRKTSKT